MIVQVCPPAYAAGYPGLEKYVLFTFVETPQERDTEEENSLNHFAAFGFSCYNCWNNEYQLKSLR